MKKFDYAVIGTATTIKVFKFDEFPSPGVTASVMNFDFDDLHYGGMGWNVAYGLSRLGCRIYPMLAYSDNRFTDQLGKWTDMYKLPKNGIIKTPVGNYDYMTGYMFENGKREHMTFGAIYGKNNPNLSMDELKHIQINPDLEMLKKCSMVILTIPKIGDVEPVLQVVEKLDLPMVFCMRNDPRVFTPELYIKTIKMSEIVFANEDETEYLMNIFNVSSVFELMQCGKTRIFAKTLGKNGSELYIREEGEKLKRYMVPVTQNEVGNIDAIGAGDGYISGFMYGYSIGKDPVTCAEYGSTVSSFVIEKPGSTTNIPTVEQMLERNRGRK